MLQKLRLLVISHRLELITAPFLLLLLVRNPSRLGLALFDFAQINPDSSVSERVALGGPTVLFVSSTQPSDERVEAAPGLPERARAGSGRVGLPEEDAAVQVNLSLSELVQVAQEVEDVVAVALRERDRRVLVLQVLSEGVPVSPLLRFVAAQRRGWGDGPRGGALCGIFNWPLGRHDCRVRNSCVFLAKY